jgi:hypothetical protein
MNKIALTTVYRGTTFRSRTEARWAVFFDHMGLPWLYEPKTVTLPSGSVYIPDFLVNYGGGNFQWFEVKATEEDIPEKDFDKIAEFDANVASIYILDGWPRFDVFMHPDTYRQEFRKKSDRFGSVIAYEDTDGFRNWVGEFQSDIASLITKKYENAVTAAQKKSFIGTAE